MDGVGSPQIAMQPFSEYFFTPLVLTMAGIVSASIAIVSFHQFMVRYCLRRLLSSSTNIISSSEPFQNLQSPNGVEEKILITIPILSYSTTDDHRNAFRVDQTECAICLGELEDGEMVRWLPNCRHAFHVTCIDNWFLGHISCPICRLSLVEPITTFDFPRSLPMVDNSDHENNEEGVQDLTQVHGLAGDASASSSRAEGLLRHSVSSVFPLEEKPQFLATALKRSLSMDQYYVLVNIQR